LRDILNISNFLWYIILENTYKYTEMTCPDCKKPMIVLEIDRVEIDSCVFCGGVWLDSGELELLVEDAAHKDSFLAKLTDAKQCPEPPIKCPLCRKKMKKIAAGGPDQLILDKCPNDHGLWLDRGELELVMSAAGYSEESSVMKLLKEIFAN